MIVQLPAQPLCRCCGKKIAKATRPIWLDIDARKSVRTIADAQKLTNLKVVSVKRSGEYVRVYSTWDGASYVDDLFCKLACANVFARIVATKYPEIRTGAHRDALARIKP